MENCMSSKLDVEHKGFKIKKLKPKNKKRGRNDRTNCLSCPNCLSKLITNSLGILECTGDRLMIWDKEFSKFYRLTPDKQVEYLKNVSSTGTFQDLYDSWNYAKANEATEKFECGYTNTLFPPNGNVKVRIPDPLFCKRIENV